MTKLLLKKMCGGEEKNWHAVISGLISSPTFFLFRSKTAAFYLFWKLVEIYVRNSGRFFGTISLLPLETKKSNKYFCCNSRKSNIYMGIGAGIRIMEPL